MSGFQFNIAPLKEPLGFIKVLEWVFSIFSFATCGGYSGETSLRVTCTNITIPDNKTLVAAFAYPFRLNTVIFKGFDEICKEKWEELHLTGDYSSPSQFYVSIAVLAFLYSLGALVFYLGYKHLYENSGNVPRIDFVITVIFAFMWLVSSSAWGKGLTDIKSATNTNNIALNHCNQTSFYKCHSGDEPHVGSLNISVAFGFLNLILWAGNAWFVFKETNLHTSPATSNPEQGPPPTSK
ncbi:PREDICTED: synaptophysin-like protein 1 [Nanorana parkeri]|uniref:synaptophysin-like protein 1 n=1 Tax=Nanorana parkeri TaxID=125878 RepID=UPI00085507B4|nr:PREDICTED: synaptophysin-like protein 1 [Nanorana parkeri]